MLLASCIDHTLLKQTTTYSDVERLCAEAAQYRFAAVCIPPVYVRAATDFLKTSDVKVCTVIGFPFGYHATAVKLEEMRCAVADGADELDVVQNVGALKNGDTDLLHHEMELMAAFSKAHNKVLKVILESSILTDDEIISCCAMYKKHPVNFLKTSTGFAEGGASVHAVQLMRQHLPSTIQIKASGGIKTAAFARDLLNAGATRLGCSASVAIVNEPPTNTEL